MKPAATGLQTCSFCRLCQAFCGTVVTVEDGIVTRINGDRDDPLSHGYICSQGSYATELLNAPARLRAPLLAKADGFAAGTSAALIAKAGRDLGRIVDQHGGGSVAFYIGTQALFNAASPHAAIALAIALETPRLFWTMTIDQSVKWIAEGRLGGWLGGIQDFDQSDTWMLFGSNPLVSMVIAGGASQFAFVDPIRRLKAARARGMKLIVVDPRKTETARMADLHLRPLPGFDADIAAALLREILANGWHDAAFCAAHVDGLDHLIAEVEPFGIEAVAAQRGARGRPALRRALVCSRSRYGHGGQRHGAEHGALLEPRRASDPEPERRLRSLPARGRAARQQRSAQSRPTADRAEHRPCADLGRGREERALRPRHGQRPDDDRDAGRRHPVGE